LLLLLLLLLLLDPTQKTDPLQLVVAGGEIFVVSSFMWRSLPSICEIPPAAAAAGLQLLQNTVCFAELLGAKGR